MMDADLAVLDEDEREHVSLLAEAWASLKPTQRAFLDALPYAGSINAAAKQVGIARWTVYDWLDSDRVRYGESGGPFTHALEQAKEAAADTLETTLHQRALDAKAGMPGVVSAIFLLKGYRPERYRENIEVKHSGTVTRVHLDLAALPDAERVALLRMALDHAQKQLPQGEG